MMLDLLLVAIDIRHHDSHHKTVLPTSWPLWKHGNRSVGNPSVLMVCVVVEVVVGALTSVVG